MGAKDIRKSEKDESTPKKGKLKGSPEQKEPATEEEITGGNWADRNKDEEEKGFHDLKKFLGCGG